MKFFSKKENWTQSIALMGLMAAINIVVAVVAAFSIVASIFLVLILPLTSVLVVLYCGEKKFLVYALATIGLSLVATFWNIDTTIFYVIPSVLTGFVFGATIKRRLLFAWSIIIATFIQTAVSLLFIPLLNLILEIDFIDELLAIFKITDQQMANILIPCAFFVIALIQVYLSYFVVRSEVRKIHTNNDLVGGEIYIPIAGISFAAAVPLFALFYLGGAYLSFLISIYFMSVAIYLFIVHKQYRYIVYSGIIVFLNFFLTAIFYNSVPDKMGLLLFAVSTLLVNTLFLLFYLLKKPRNLLK